MLAYNTTYLSAYLICVASFTNTLAVYNNYASQSYSYMHQKPCMHLPYFTAGVVDIV